MFLGAPAQTKQGQMSSSGAQDAEEWNGHLAPFGGTVFRNRSNKPVEVDVRQSFRVETYSSNGESCRQGGVRFRLDVLCDAHAVDVERSVEDHGNGSYTFAWRPPAAGRYTLQVVSSPALQIYDDVFQVTVVPSNRPAHSATVFPSLSGKAGVEQKFVIQTKQSNGEKCLSGGCDFVVNVVPLDEDYNTDYPDPYVTDRFNGTYEVRWMPLRPGKYRVNVLCDTPTVEKIYGQQKLTEIEPGDVDASLCTVELLDTEVYTTQEQFFEIVARDAFGNEYGKGGTEFTVSVRGPSGKALSSIELADQGDGHYVVSYLPRLAGKYTFRITMEGVEVRDSPVTVRAVHPPFDPSKTLVNGEVDDQNVGMDTLRTGVVNNDAMFVIQACNCFGVPMRKGGLQFYVRLLGPITYRPQVVDNNDGSYTVRYALPLSGHYLVVIRCSGEDIQGSPFALNVVPSSIHGESWVAGGTGIFHATAMVPSEFELLYAGVNADDNDLEDIRPEDLDPKSKMHSLQGIAHAHRLGKQVRSFSLSGPSGGGSGAGGGSPSAPTSPRLSLYRKGSLPGDAMAPRVGVGSGMGVGSAGQESGEVLSPRTSGGGLGGTLTTSTSTSSTSETWSVAGSTTSGWSSRRSKSTVGGGSGRRRKKRAPPDIPEVYSNGRSREHILSRGGVDQPSGEAENFVVKLDGPIHVTGSVVERKQGGYKVKYTVPTSGDYTLKVLYRNAPVYGSPFLVHVDAVEVDAQACTAEGRALRVGVPKKAMKFTIQARDHKGKRIKHGGQNFSVALNGPCSVAGVVEDNGNGTHTASYMVPATGAFQLAVKSDGEHIQGSPFQVSIKPYAERELDVFTLGGKEEEGAGKGKGKGKGKKKKRKGKGKVERAASADVRRSSGSSTNQRRPKTSSAGSTEQLRASMGSRGVVFASRKKRVEQEARRRASEGLGRSTVFDVAAGSSSNSAGGVSGGRKSSTRSRKSSSSSSSGKGRRGSGKEPVVRTMHFTSAFVEHSGEYVEKVEVNLEFQVQTSEAYVQFNDEEPEYLPVLTNVEGDALECWDLCVGTSVVLHGRVVMLTSANRATVRWIDYQAERLMDMKEKLRRSLAGRQLALTRPGLRQSTKRTGGVVNLRTLITEVDELREELALWDPQRSEAIVRGLV